MFARPPGARPRQGGEGEGVYYGCGWKVRPAGKRPNISHTGSLAGTSTLLVRARDGLTWAVLFNTRSGGGKNEPSGPIDPLVHKAADQVKEWPKKDLYPRR